MRVMEIPPFPRRIEILDLENFIRTRMSQTVVMWPAQAIPLVGYMCWPNDLAARNKSATMLRDWPRDPEHATLPPRLHVTRQRNGAGNGGGHCVQHFAAAISKGVDHIS